MAFNRDLFLSKRGKNRKTTWRSADAEYAIRLDGFAKGDTVSDVAKLVKGTVGNNDGLIPVSFRRQTLDDGSSAKRACALSRNDAAAFIVGTDTGNSAEAPQEQTAGASS